MHGPTQMKSLLLDAANADIFLRLGQIHQFQKKQKEARIAYLNACE